MIGLDRRNNLTHKEVDSFADAWTQVTAALEQEIAEQYPRLGDPYQAHLFRYWGVIKFFNGMLPAWYNGLLRNPRTARLFRRLAGSAQAQQVDAVAMDLFNRTSVAIGEKSQDKINQTLDFDDALNHDFDCQPRDLPKVLGRGLRLQARLLWNVWRQLHNATPSWPNLRYLPVIARTQVIGSLMPILLAPFCGWLLRDCEPVKVIDASNRQIAKQPVAI